MVLRNGMMLFLNGKLKDCFRNNIRHDFWIISQKRKVKWKINLTLDSYEYNNKEKRKW